MFAKVRLVACDKLKHRTRVGGNNPRISFCGHALRLGHLRFYFLDYSKKCDGQFFELPPWRELFASFKQEDGCSITERSLVKCCFALVGGLKYYVNCMSLNYKGILSCLLGFYYPFSLFNLFPFSFFLQVLALLMLDLVYMSGNIALIG